MNELHPKAGKADLAAAVSRGVLGAIPLIGPLAAEAVSSLIPKQKLDRVVDFVAILSSQVSTLHLDVATIKGRFEREAFLDLFEDGVLHASRALSDDRKKAIAALLANSISEEQLRYEQTKKLLRLLDSLLDPEIILLNFHGLRGDAKQAYQERHRDLIRPDSFTDDRDEYAKKMALLQNYDDTLVRLGLLNSQDDLTRLAPLGRLLLREIQPPSERTAAERTDD